MGIETQINYFLSSSFSFSFEDRKAFVAIRLVVHTYVDEHLQLKTLGNEP